MLTRRDWSKYNKELINRGKINFWINPKIFKEWKAKRKKKNGRPFTYGNELIKAMSYMRFKYHLSLRETEGFFQSLLVIMKKKLKVPSYTQLCRRIKELELLQELISKKDVTDIVLDTTGLKVYGAGEWCSKRYGGKKGWKKLHLALDPESGQLVLAEVTGENVHDTGCLEKAFRRTNRKKGKALIDGIGDSKRCYSMAKSYGKELLTPPKKGAVFRKEPGYEKRNEAIKIIRAFGGDPVARSIWAKLVGYNERVVIESMISRWKRLFGGSLRSQCKERQQVEVQLKAMMINEMIRRKAA
jgi:hypothetical protein